MYDSSFLSVEEAQDCVVSVNLQGCPWNGVVSAADAARYRRKDPHVTQPTPGKTTRTQTEKPAETIASGETNQSVLRGTVALMFRFYGSRRGQSPELLLVGDGWPMR